MKLEFQKSESISLHRVPLGQLLSHDTSPVSLLCCEHPSMIVYSLAFVALEHLICQIQ